MSGNFGFAVGWVDGRALRTDDFFFGGMIVALFECLSYLAPSPWPDCARLHRLAIGAQDAILPHPAPEQFFTSFRL
jgi:hypothetical protein